MKDSDPAKNTFSFIREHSETRVMHLFRHFGIKRFDVFKVTLIKFVSTV